MRAVVWLVVAACGTARTQAGIPPGAECIDNSGCALGQVCTEALTCRAVECVASADCGFGERCDVDAFACVIGCGSDADCLASEVCDAEAEQCVSRSCVDTHRDCSVGEVCARGVCEPARGDWCSGCDSGPAQCGAAEECIEFEGAAGAFCYDRCRTDADCPSGFDCLVIDLQPGGPTPLCYANCGFLTDQGYL